jgi:uncharacterized protein YodC (DUF2158 family)
VTWKTGHLVQLKSGGPLMTVREVSDQGVECRWFDKDRLRSETFVDEELEAGKSPKFILNIDLGEHSGVARVPEGNGEDA